MASGSKPLGLPGATAKEASLTVYGRVKSNPPRRSSVTAYPGQQSNHPAISPGKGTYRLSVKSAIVGDASFNKDEIRLEEGRVTEGRKAP